LIEELTELVQADAKAHDVQYRLELATGLPRIDADGPQIQQVVLNLVRNALEALSETSGGNRHITVRTGLTPNSDVEISVCDNGPGVPASVSHRLFHPFCTSKPAGTGLGLAISRTIVAAHRGTLDHRANSPNGACFAARLPAIRADDP
jgi:signal transduction histidine kinase